MPDPTARREASPFSEAPLQPLFVWAHRGASALEPENTMAAFLTACDLGADGIELDVQLSADGVPVVVHDPVLHHDGRQFHLRRPTAEGAPCRRVFVGDVPFAELTASPVVFPDGRRAPLERLEAVVEALPGWIWLDVELKAGWTYDSRLASVVAGCLGARPERCLASSFDHVVLAELHRCAPDLPLAALCDARLVDPPAVLGTIPAGMWNLRRAFITKDDVVSLRERGVLVSLYGEEVRHQLDELSSWPLSGVFLDDPREAWPPAGTAPGTLGRR